MDNPKPKKRIAAVISLWLLIIVFIAFFVSSALVYRILYEREDRTSVKTLQDNMEGGTESYRDALLDDTLHVAKFFAPALGRRFADHPGNETAETRSFIKQYLDSSDISEMTLVDREGKIIISSDKEIIGRTLDDEDFKPLFDLFEIEEPDEEVPTAYVEDAVIRDTSIIEYSAAIVPDTDMMLLCGLTEQDVKNCADYYAARPAVSGPFDKIIYLNATGDQVIAWSSRNDDIGKKLSDIGIDLPDDQVYECEVIKCRLGGEKVYLTVDNSLGFYIINVHPESEIMSSMRVAFASMQAAIAAVFVMLYFVVSRLIRRVVVRRIDEVAGSLSRITSGDLEERVNVRSTVEFESLSDDINSTVDRLKEYIEEANSRIDKDLAIAREIQSSSLPAVSALPKRDEITIAVEMDPAKEVGGDFYDFYYLDDSHLVLAIADVSGKSIPGAMFMMRSKALIKNRMVQGGSLSEAVGDVNDLLCEGNDAGMFVTLWMAVLDIGTGKGMAINAGHEHPALRKKDGSFEMVKYRHSPAVATMEGIPFRQHEFEMEPGDCLFVYTDGVPEATNDVPELFGEERTLEALNRDKDAGPQELIRNVMEDIDAFVGEAEQFDDITMLSVLYHGK